MGKPLKRGNTITEKEGILGKYNDEEQQCNLTNHGKKKRKKNGQSIKKGNKITEKEGILDKYKESCRKSPVPISWWPDSAAAKGDAQPLRNNGKT